MKSVKMSSWVLVLGILLVGCILMAVDNPLIRFGNATDMMQFAAIVMALCLVILFLDGIVGLSYQSIARLEFFSRWRKLPVDMLAALKDGAQKPALAEDLSSHLRLQYGPLWRYKVRMLLVVGEAEQIEAIAPGLGQHRWLEAAHGVLLWGGDLHSEPSAEQLDQWRSLTRWRGLDGYVWALDAAQSSAKAHMAPGIRRLGNLSRQLGWRSPLHLWQVCHSDWPQPDRSTQPIGTLLPRRAKVDNLRDGLIALVQPLREQGICQLQVNAGHDFLWRLARDLQAQGIARWCQVLGPLLPVLAKSVPLCALWFSLPLQQGAKGGLDHYWAVDEAWSGVLAVKKVFVPQLGWGLPKLAHRVAMTMAAMALFGMLGSFAANRARIAHIGASVQGLEQADPGGAQLSRLYDLSGQLALLEQRAWDGEPWYYSFGLSRNKALLDALWPRFEEASSRLLRNPAAAALEHKLHAFLLPGGDTAEPANGVMGPHDLLKAYLMLAQPEKTEAVFLADVLIAVVPEHMTKTAGAAQELSPYLWQFYSTHLAAHPQWRIEPDEDLIRRVRHLLLAQVNQLDTEATLYRQILMDAGLQYLGLELQQMVADTDASLLFTSNEAVPGVFTRQAWEGHISNAIEEIGESRREKIDWVLSAGPADGPARHGADQLKQRLTERYFSDYGRAWLLFVNSLRWQPAVGLNQTIGQLTLMSDARQSPLIALMNTLSFQGQAGMPSSSLTDSIISSAQQFIKSSPAKRTDQLDKSEGPLDSTFGPLLAIMGSDSKASGKIDHIGLQSYLASVTRVRLRLQQINSAVDPQQMNQALAQMIFQGKSTELSDGQSHARVMAASLGTEWSDAGHALFVQGMEQAWQKVLQPAAASLNKQWQRGVVSDWNEAFAGRYPFAATSTDASLPMIGQMIRAESGRIDQFLQRELGGIVRKEGGRWVADARHGQGLLLDPQFLAAINQLTRLADVLYTDGGMGLSFELQGKGVQDVVQTTFILDGETHHYYNQRERWQRFVWPGNSDHPGTRLSWTSVNTGERLYGDYQGVWGLIRWLETTHATPLDDHAGRYQVVATAPDGLGLTWHLRTQLGAGPLALLKLRGFELPQQIFLAPLAQAAL